MKSKIIIIIFVLVIVCCISCNRLETIDKLESNNNQIESSITQTTDTFPQTNDFYTLASTDTVQSSTFDDTQSQTDITNLLNFPEQVNTPIKEAIHDLQIKGWKDIEVIEGEPDSIERWGSLVIEPYDLNEDSVLYSIIGNTDDISAVIRIVLDNKTSIAKRVEVFYVAISGRDIKGINLESFLKTRLKSDEILSADDRDMHIYLMDSY